MTDSAPPRPLTLPDVLEAMADEVGDRRFVETIDAAYTYAQIDERANRLANHLLAQGIGHGDHVAVHAHNRIEWIDAFFGALKIGAVPVNINYKYLRDELAHVYDDADCVAAVIAPDYVDVAGDLLTSLRHVLVMDESYAAAMAAAGGQRPDVDRSGDDHYVIYTGGTTGSPKGVVWRQADLIRAALNAARYGAPIESVEALATEAAATENPMVLMACGPLMHGGSQWIMGNALISGQRIALYTEPSFDAERVLDLAAKSRTVSLAMLGDAMARPIAEAVLAEPERWDLSALAAVSNGAAPLSLGVREEIRAAFPGKFILDSYGASESGATGSSFDTGDGDGSARFGVTDEVQVFTPDLTPAAVGERGMLGRSGPIPIGYYRDETRTASTFKEIDGVRWVLPGDFARREEDGTVTVLGRGSVCINTGGEKVHPEEVEAVLLRHAGVFDAVVVGTPHEHWGQQVTALVHRRDGVELTEADLIAHAHSLIANYKVPKQIFFVEAVPRTPVSKVDYPAATAQARRLTGS